MIKKPLVISQVVDNDLCTGCGLCTYKCPSDALGMKLSAEGFLVPELLGVCDNDAACISVCPFNPTPEEAVKDETALADIFLSDGTETHEKLGRLIGTYAGYSKEYRETSSSGGLATYIFDQLLDRGIVDHVFSVRSSEESGKHYQYKVSSSKEDLRDSSKTKYYPVTLATVLPELDRLEGRVAIVGVACFVKAIRLAQYHEPALKDKIPFVAGIICGGVKSTFFTEYLASRARVVSDKIKSPEYRIKNEIKPALDYSFACEDLSNGSYRSIRMREIGDMWGTGLFKANACDFCDDVTSELADISLGDAWIEPYNNDGRGTSVILTRSPLAEEIMQDGMKSSAIFIEPISPERMRASQQGSYNHRHEGLYVRLSEAQKKGISISEKRYGKQTVSLDVKVLHKLRRVARKKSLEVWGRTNAAPAFDKEMHRTLFYLRLATRATAYKRTAMRRVKGLLK